MRQKEQVSRVYSDMVYRGLWFTDLREALDAFINVSQRVVTGTVRVELYKGNCTVCGMRSPWSLYDTELATYGSEDTFHHEAAQGFLEIYNLEIKVQGRRRERLDSCEGSSDQT